MAFYAVPATELAGRLLHELCARGLEVRRTFDLQSARVGLADPGAGLCPRHGTRTCSCQYLVLQVSRGGTPVALLLYGREGFTEVDLVSTDPDTGAMQNEILAALDGLRRRRRGVGTAELTHVNQGATGA